MPRIPHRWDSIHCRRCGRVTPHWRHIGGAGPFNRHSTLGVLVIALVEMIACPWTCQVCGSERRWRR
jgi:hypothetical protein